MNLSMTPLNEAYNLPKLKPKLKPNIHVNSEHQKQVLKDSNMEIHTKIPSGYTEKPAFITNEIQQLPVVKEDVLEDENLLTVKITDPELIEMLKPYKDDYISKIIKSNMKGGVEFFQNKETSSIDDFDIKILIGILILLVIVDINVRRKC
jgi:hypothetical protein